MNSNVPLQVLQYDGTTDARAFRRDFELQCFYQSWDAERQLLALPKFIYGKAMRAYTAITTKTEINATLTSLVDALQPPEDVLLAEFLERKLLPGEKVSRLALNLQELLLKAMPTLTDAQRLPMLRSQLCKSLNESMRGLVQFNSGMAWDKLIVALDKAMPHVLAAANQSADAYGYAPQTQGLPLIKLEPTAEAFAADARGSQSDQRRSDNNHFSSRQGQHSQRSGNYGNRNSNTNRGAKKFDGNCSYCGIYGHMK